MQDNFGIKGKVSWVLYDEFGHIKSVGEEQNTICANHDVIVADRMAGGSDTLIGWGWAGTGNGQTSSDTNLDAVITSADDNRIALTSHNQTGVTNDVVYIFTLAAGVCSAQIEEIGLFNSAPTNATTMCCYSEAISVLKAAGDTLTITWTVSYGSS